MDLTTDLRWESLDSHVLINPKLSGSQIKALQSAVLPALPGHVWLLTSGTESSTKLKLVALSKKALLRSAESVNRHLQSTAKDRWLNVLPHYHVGGLGIFARAHLSGAKVLNPSPWSWNVGRFFESLNYDRISLTSLVPTQIFDLVKAQVLAPSTLRAVVVGGGALNESLYLSARQLGWKLLPSYGLTECASQVATAELSSLDQNKELPMLKILDHVKAKCSSAGILSLQSESLLTGYLIIDNEGHTFFDPKKNGWLETQDLAEVDGGFLKPLGRRDEVVKVKGELVALPQLNSELNFVLQQFFPDLENCAAMMSYTDIRQENGISLVATQKAWPKVQAIHAELKKLLRPVELPKTAYLINDWPVTDLGKIKWSQIRQQLGL
jgi:O-succinylbenzoic acid--CoA ligase